MPRWCNLSATPAQSDAGNPSWKTDFVASSLGAVTFNNKIYGIPLAGTQPVFFFYNKALLATYHLSFPTTTTQLLADVVDPGQAERHGSCARQQRGMAWSHVPRVLRGPHRRASGVPQHPGRQERRLVQPCHYPGPHRHPDPGEGQRLRAGLPIRSSFGTGFTEAMIHNGVAAMQLMGDWDIGFMQGYYPGWVASGDMGIGFFPTVPGGKGNPADLEGNTTSYAELATHISPAETYVAEKFVAWLFATQAYAKFEVSQGLVPVIAGSAPLLNSSPLKQYLVPISARTARWPPWQSSRSTGRPSGRTRLPRSVHPTTCGRLLCVCWPSSPTEDGVVHCSPAQAGKDLQCNRQMGNAEWGMRNGMSLLSRRSQSVCAVFFEPRLSGFVPIPHSFYSSVNRASSAVTMPQSTGGIPG